MNSYLNKMLKTASPFKGKLKWGFLTVFIVFLNSLVIFSQENSFDKQKLDSLLEVSNSLITEETELKESIITLDSSISRIEHSKNYIQIKTQFFDNNFLDIKVFKLLNNTVRIEIIDSCEMEINDIFNFILQDDDIKHREFIHVMPACFFQFEDLVQSDHSLKTDKYLNFSLKLLDKLEKTTNNASFYSEDK